MGSALLGSLQISCFLTRTFRVLPLTYLYFPKSARAYFVPQSGKIHYFYSDPISVDPICPQPRRACVGGASSWTLPATCSTTAAPTRCCQ